jgi:hypothetical protein
MCAFGIFFWDAEVEAWLSRTTVSKWREESGYVRGCVAHVAIALLHE